MLFFALASLVGVIPSVSHGYHVIQRDVASEEWMNASAAWNALPYNSSATAAAVWPDSVYPTCGDVVRASSTADAVAALNALAGTSPVRVQARSGRHGYLASGSNTDGAVVLDLRDLDGIEGPFTVPCASVPSGPTQQTPCMAVRAGPGLRLFDLYAGLAALGYYFPGGTCPTVAIGGFILGGGYGPWSRMMGMGVDNVVNFTTIKYAAPSLSNRRFGLANRLQYSSHEVSPDTDPALFQAMLGAGNNALGPVTSMTLRVFPQPQILSLWRINIDNLTTCRDSAVRLFQEAIEKDWRPMSTGTLPFASSQPLNLALDVYHNGCAALFSGVDIPAATLKTAVMDAGWLGLTGATADPVAAPTQGPWIEQLATTHGCDTVAACKEKTLNEYPNPASPGRWIALSTFQYAPLNQQQINAVFDAVSRPTSNTFVVLIFDQFGGALNGTATATAQQLNHEQTSFVHHDALYHVQMWLEPASTATAGEVEAARAWAIGVLAAFDGAVVANGFKPGAYRNYPSPLMQNPQQRYYGTQQRVDELARITRSVDPLGVFRSEQTL